MPLADEISPSNAPSLNGWTPPIMYDVSVDRWRIMTQADADSYTALQQAYNGLRLMFKQIEADHQNLIAHVREIAAREGK